MAWKLHFSKAARKDAAKLQQYHLQANADVLFDILERDPFETPPPFERLVGELDGYISRRINIQHRLVYRVDIKAHRVFIERMWTHYESRHGRALSEGRAAAKAPLSASARGEVDARSAAGEGQGQTSLRDGRA
jgi:toxin YoeB